MSLEHLSFSSIKKLLSSEKQFYKRYIKKEYDNVWAENLIVWIVVHKWVELFNNDKEPTDYESFINRQLDSKREDYIKKLDDDEEPEEWDDRGSWFYRCKRGIINFMQADLPRASYSEYKVLTHLTDNDVKFKAYIDAIFIDQEDIKDHTTDYKTVSRFSSLDGYYGTEKLDKYMLQWALYVLAVQQYDMDIYTHIVQEFKKTNPRKEKDTEYQRTILDNWTEIKIVKKTAHRLIEFQYSKEALEFYKDMFDRYVERAQQLSSDNMLFHFGDTEVEF